MYLPSGLGSISLFERNRADQKNLVFSDICIYIFLFLFLVCVFGYGDG